MCNAVWDVEGTCNFPLIFNGVARSSVDPYMVASVAHEPHGIVTMLSIGVESMMDSRVVKQSRFGSTRLALQERGLNIISSRMRGQPVVAWVVVTERVARSTVSAGAVAVVMVMNR